MTVHNFDAVVVGSGASGYAAACRIAQIGKKSVCIVTEGKNIGTSRNTGSDKQTYYKLGLAGDAPDSVRALARTLFDGGCVDGDIALCEAALSTRCFNFLCEAGVPFPCNEYGEYVGYKTDHDPMCRATSAGPLTSKFMTEALEKRAEVLGIPVFDGLFAIEVLKKEGQVTGLLCLDLQNGENVAFSAPNVILATGGPAGIYADSVYPEYHHGSSSLALHAGASLQNMTEWQYGLASRFPRWNVSGTYMQVLPRFISLDEKGREFEFLAEYYDDIYTALSAVFMKGYQWPFDVNKARDGSSVIDLLVYRETVMRGRRVYLDFTKNPFRLENIEFEKLSKEAFEYLKRSGACFGSPIERLKRMNMPAVELYRSKGIDLERERLEVALCAQHCNGGIAVNCRWESGLRGLFAVGETAGTHGITRPGGSALNAGQVGALRATEEISRSERDAQELEIPSTIVLDPSASSPIDFASRLATAQKKMSAVAGAIRDMREMARYLTEIKSVLMLIGSIRALPTVEQIKNYYLFRDTLTVQAAVLTAMVVHAKRYGCSRGSALYTDGCGEAPIYLDDTFSFTLPSSDDHRKEIGEVTLENGKFESYYRRVRPIPREDKSFEAVWRRYRGENDV